MDYKRIVRSSRLGPNLEIGGAIASVFKTFLTLSVNVNYSLLQRAHGSKIIHQGKKKHIIIKIKNNKDVLKNKKTTPK